MRFCPIQGFIRRVLRTGIGERLLLVAFEAVPAAQSDTTQAGSVAIHGIPDRKKPEKQFKGTNTFFNPAVLYAQLCGANAYAWPSLMADAWWRPCRIRAPVSGACRFWTAPPRSATHSLTLC